MKIIRTNIATYASEESFNRTKKRKALARKLVRDQGYGASKAYQIATKKIK